MQDAILQGSAKLPADGSTASTSSIDLQNSSTGEWSPDFCEFMLTPPALTGTQLPSSNYISYTVYTGLSSTAGTSAVAILSLPNQYGIGTSGSVSPAPMYFRLPVQGVNRYLTVTAGTGGGSTVASSATFTLAAVFGKN